jgi:hypothetical protein
MKIFAMLAVILTTAFCALADISSLERFSPHFSTNTPILWTASTNHLPKNIWTYRRLGPRVFPATVISNAIVLASLQSKGFPKPSANQTCYTADEDANSPCGHPCIFSINPDSASLSYSIRHPNMGSVEDIPSDETIVKLAWDCALRLDVKPAEVVGGKLASHFNSDENGDRLTNQISGRNIYLSRQLDGVCFWGNGDDSSNDGFWIEFGRHGVVRGFSLTWPNLERHKSLPIVNPDEIIACIRAHKIIVIPNADEERYFDRVKALANARKFTITKITPYYMEGVFGEVPANNEPSKIVAPIAELEAVADFGNSNLTVRLLSPILSWDVNRLLMDNSVTPTNAP